VPLVPATAAEADAGMNPTLYVPYPIAGWGVPFDIGMVGQFVRERAVDDDDILLWRKGLFAMVLVVLVVLVPMVSLWRNGRRAVVGRGFDISRRDASSLISGWE